MKRIKKKIVDINNLPPPLFPFFTVYGKGSRLVVVDDEFLNML